MPGSIESEVIVVGAFWGWCYKPRSHGGVNKSHCESTG